MAAHSTQFARQGEQSTNMTRPMQGLMTTFLFKPLTTKPEFADAQQATYCVQDRSFNNTRSACIPSMLTWNIRLCYTMHVEGFLSTSVLVVPFVYIGEGRMRATYVELVHSAILSLICSSTVASAGPSFRHPPVCNRHYHPAAPTRFWSRSSQEMLSTHSCIVSAASF